MYRYFVLTWDSSDGQATAVARRLVGQLHSSSRAWTPVVNGEGLAVFQEGVHPQRNSAHMLGAQTGVVLGTLFSRDSACSFLPAAVALTAQESSAILASGGRHLITKYWGQYVAVIHDPAAGTTRIVRDPSGTLPCFQTTCAGVHVFFSDIEDCVRLGSLSFSINWKYVTASVAKVTLQLSETALNEVTEVQPGECVCIRCGPTSLVAVEKELYWSPVEVACNGRIEDPDEAIATLRHTVRACVHAWASCHESIIHSLSGGLDSSIVLSCLQDAPTRPAITCFNYSFERSGADERRFARLAAQRAGCEMREHVIDTNAIRLDRLLEISRSPKPWYYLNDVMNGSFEAQLAAECRASAIFTGNGGDKVFLQSRTESAVGDYVYNHGIGLRLLRVARDAAEIDRRSFWTLLRSGIRAGLREPRWAPGEREYIHNAFIHPDVLAWRRAHRSYLTPATLQTAERVPQGKLWQINYLAASLPFYRAFEERDCPQSVRPLLCQPVVEACLRIPTYVLIHGGWDRAIARRAFEPFVPAEIIHRRSKGGAGRLMKEIVEKNIGFLRELLLDGVLVKERLLDRPKLEAFLCGHRSAASLEYNELLISRINPEVWLRRWQDLSRQAAA
jgi:asparagine synthase (glutamine-hydrolysing)